MVLALVLNNQVVTALLVVLLILLIVFYLQSFIFVCTNLAILAIVGLPIILAGILYYLMNPVVDYFEKRKYQGFTVSLGCLFGCCTNRMGERSDHP